MAIDTAIATATAVTTEAGDEVGCEPNDDGRDMGPPGLGMDRHVANVQKRFVGIKYESLRCYNFALGL